MYDLASVIRETAQSLSRRIALIHQGEERTFGDILISSERWRGIFQDAGVERQDRILMLMENSFDTVAAMLAAWSEGAIICALSENSPPSHIEHALEKTGAKIVVSDITGLSLSHGTTLRCTKDLLTARTVTSQIKTSLPTDPASIFFTSGSTGKPKGVVQSHGNLIRATKTVANYLKLRESDILLCPVPWSFDYGFGQLLATLVCGIPQVLPNPTNPVGICNALETQRATVIGGTPGVYSFLLGGMSPIKKTDVASVRLIMNTGGAIPQRILKLLGEIFCEAEIILNYGLTETYRSCYLPFAELETGKNSIGIPIPGVDIAIVDDNGNQVPDLTEGELVHRGDYVCLGYWNDKELTAKAVRPDPLAAKGTPNPPLALYTGDYGYRGEDGYVYLTGRRDNLIKSMGVRISTQEIESLIYESELVEEVAVFGIPSDLLGYEVWAAIVSSNTEEKTLKSALQKYCKQAMSSYMHPQRYLILPELPRTSNGKIDYGALKTFINK